MDRFRYGLGNVWERVIWKPKYSCPFTRFLSYQRAENLSQLLAKAFEARITVSDVNEVAKLLRRIEARMDGRIAGDLDDHILNYFMILAAASVGDKNALHGEIGVLFGGSLLLTLHASNKSYVHRKIVAIDPLDSYYGTARDPLTLLPLSENTVKTNVIKLGFDITQVHLIAALSESDNTLNFVKDLKFASLWIDGDHSYEGVKRDWINYSRLVVPNGYVLIDNYHDQLDEYPGIDRFIDTELLPNLKGWVTVVNFGRSILFRKLP